MVDKPTSGSILGVPYNFERPGLGRILSSYWQPGESMLVEKPFGIGYTLNLANWRAWVVIGVVAALFYHEQSSQRRREAAPEEPVEVLVED